MGGPAGEREPRVTCAHQLGELVMDDLHHLLARVQVLQHLLAERPLAHARDEVLDDAEVDVCLEQGQADLAHGARDRLLVEAFLAAEVAEGGAELVGKRVKHGRPSVRAPFWWKDGRGPISRR